MFVFLLPDPSKEMVAGERYKWLSDDISFIRSNAGIPVEVLPKDVTSIWQKLCLFFLLIYAQSQML